MKGRFLARGDAMCPDFAAQERVRQYVGRKLVVLDADSKAPRSSFEPAITENDIVTELIRECREGAVWPADEATAKACGVVFDPKFGGEYDTSASASQPKKPAAEARKEKG